MNTAALFPSRTRSRDIFVVEGYCTAAGTTVNMAVTFLPGVVSVARTADGKFTVTFGDANFGTLIGAEIIVHNAAGTAPLVGACPLLAYTKNVTTVTSTTAIEIWDLATPSLAIPPANSIVEFKFKFTKQTLATQ